MPLPLQGLRVLTFRNIASPLREMPTALQPRDQA